MIEETCELISFLAIIIIYFYQRNNRSDVDYKSKIFLSLLLSIAIASLISYISCIAINNYTVIPVWINEIIQMLYFLTSPIMPTMFLCYFISYIFEEKSTHQKIKYGIIAFIPSIVFSILVLTNPLHHLLFYFDGCYVRGSLNNLAFFFVFIIALFIFIFVFIYMKKLGKKKSFVLISFPVISLIIVGLEFLYSYFGRRVILTGSAATISALVIYIYLQHQMVMVDDLTGLKGRKLGISKVNKLFNSSESKTIGRIKLNNIHEIRSKFGNDIADLLTKEAANYLSTLIGYNNLFLYRDNEFIFISSGSESGYIVSNVLNSFNEEWKIDNRAIKIVTHVAVIDIPKEADSFEEAMNLLQIALKKCYNSSENIIYCDSSLRQEYIRENIIRDKIINAIENDLIVPLFQPVYQPSKKRYYRAEALARIKDGEGLISSSDFIDIAEKEGYVEQIDFIIFKKALDLLQQIDHEDFEGISINFTPTHFNNPLFADKIIKMIDEAKIKRERVGIEITERLFIGNNETIINNIKMLTNNKIRLYLDDFGTGFSNLSLAISLPFDTIKIDRSLVLEADNNSKSLEILSSLIGSLLSHNLNVVVEGVETLNQANMIIKTNCDLIQGYYYSKPIKDTELLKLIKK